MGNAFGALRRQNPDEWKDVENMPYLADHERADLLKLRRKMDTTEKLIRYARNNSENGTQLISPLIDEFATEAYILFIRDYLTGNIEEADMRFKSEKKSILLCAHYLSSVRPVYQDEFLYRGMNLPQAPTGPFLPYTEEHSIYSYTDDITVACGFAAMGSGVPVLLRSRPHPRRVLFHYSYLLLFPYLFGARVGIFDPVEGEPLILRGLSGADIYHLLPQREVLLWNTSSFKQRIVSTAGRCYAKTRYVMMGEDTEARYERAMRMVKGNYREFNTYPDPRYQTIQELAQRESIADLTPVPEGWDEYT